MNYINTKAVKELAKKVGSEAYGKDLNVSSDFVQQVDHLVRAIVIEQVLKQENLAKTLRSTSWAEINLAEAARRHPELKESSDG